MANQPNIMNDLGVLFKLPSKVTAELTQKANLCIGSIIADARNANEQTVLINIGIGVLSVNLIDMQCKFVPSKELKAIIKSSLESEIDPLELALEESLAEKLITVCNEVL